MGIGKYIVKLLLTLLVPYAIGWLVLYVLLPQFYFDLYPYVVLVFLAMGLPYYSIISRSSSFSHRKFFTWVAIHTLSKLMLSLTIILLYIFLIKTHIASFLIVYIVFYFVLSAFETALFVGVSKNQVKVHEN